MNIFAFDQDPVKCAQWLDNSRVGKLLMEANQMMSTAILENGGEPLLCGPDQLCRPSHQNHPVTKWVGRTWGNFEWTLRYALALRDEYAHRYNGTIHGSARRIPCIIDNSDLIPDGPLEPFQNSARHGGLGLDFTSLPVCQAYREYALARWELADNPPNWHKRSAPEWYR